MVDTVICMRTTLEFEDALLKAAKRRAAEEGKTLTRLLEDALRRYLDPAEKRKRPFRLKLLTKKGRRVPGVNISDRDSLYERMDGRE